MKRLALAVSIFAASIVSASAADLAVPYSKAPPPVVAPIYDWGGFYVGANGGWGSSHKCWDFVSPALVPDGCHNATGGVAGGQIGFRQQVGFWVFGFEAQGDWADLNGSNASLFFAGLRNHSQIDGFGLLTAQGGVAWNNFLFYVKGGGAFVGDRFDIRTAGDVVVASGDNRVRWGGVIGAGVEVAFALNWSVAFEYDHLFLQDQTVNFFLPASTTLLGSDRIRQGVDLATVRLNYRIGGAFWDAPR